MSPKKNRQFFFKIFSSPKFLSFMGMIIIVLISIPLAKNISKRNAIDEEILDLEQEIKNLEGQNKDLKNFIGYLESDQFVEEQARLKLGLKKEGESVVVLQDDKNSSLNMGGNSVDKNELSNPKKWWQYFFYN